MSNQINVAIIGTGIFATNAHLPTLVNSEHFKPVSCYNHTIAKAQEFSTKCEPNLTVYETFDDAFKDPEVDLIDVLLPAQLNLKAVEHAVKFNKNIVIEKPIAANLDQAKEIVKISRENPQIVIAVNEHWCFLKAVSELKSAIAKIGKVVGFNYHSTGSFNFSNKYLNTKWRQNPEHIGGFLSDGGVHQLALLTSVLGNVKSLNARTKQVREQSGDVDAVWSLMELENGLIGSFNYGSSFGNKDKKGFFEILGDNGSIYYDFSPKTGDRIVLKTGGLTVDEPNAVEEIKIDGEFWSTEQEFQNLALKLKGDDNTEIVTPETAFHHLAIVAAMLESAANDSQTATVQLP